MEDSDVRPPLSKREAIDAISRYLPHEWSSLTEDQVTVNCLTGGYINTVNLVTRSTKSVLEPNQVVVHRSGGGGYQSERGKGTSFASRFEELLIFHESSRIGTAPKLYGMCEELTVQEFFKGHTITPEECANPKILTKLAQVYAKFHSINVPTDRLKYSENITEFKRINDSFLKSKDQITKSITQAYPNLDWDGLFDFNYLPEYEWVIKVTDRIGYREVINTGDQNHLNVMVSEDGERIVLIDYEMSKYHPRGFDLAGHLVNRAIKWNDKKNKVNGHDILDEALRRQFITEYCKESAKHIKDFDPNGLDSVDHVMEETDFGLLAFSLFWGVGLLLEMDKLIDMDGGSFCTVSNHLIKSYFSMKGLMLQKYPHWK